jgi:hypothetical protein
MFDSRQTQAPGEWSDTKKGGSMSELALNIFHPKEIVRLKAVLNEVVLSFPKQQRSCEMQVSVAAQLLKLAAGGEKDPIRLKERALLALRNI